MGPWCLTAVFGMGTGVSTMVSSPEKPAVASLQRLVQDAVPWRQGGGLATGA